MGSTDTLHGQSDSDAKVWLTVEEAMSRLAVIEDYDPGDGPKPCVHTYRIGALVLGAHWSVEQAKRAFEKYGVEEAGPNAQALGHGLAITDDAGPVLFETVTGA